MKKLTGPMLSLLLDILEAMAKLRCITDVQALRLFRQYSLEEIFCVLGWAVEHELIAPMTVYIPVETDTNIRYGSTETRPVEILYIEAPGKAFLLEHRDVWCLKTLYPTRAHLLRMFHNLLVVEALIWMTERNEVVEFWVEDQLRSDGLNLPDLRVQVHLGAEDYEFIACEVVVQNKRQAVNEKSSMIYFTPSRTQKGLIQDMKPHDKVVQINLDGVPKSPVIIPPTNLSRSQENIFQALREHAGILTAGAVAVLVGRRQPKVSAALSKLARAGHLSRSRVQSAPGLQKGSPHVLYALDPCLSETWADEEFALRYSLFIEFFAAREIQVSDVDRKSETAVISRGRFRREIPVRELDDLQAWWDKLVAEIRTKRKATEAENR